MGQRPSRFQKAGDAVSESSASYVSVFKGNVLADRSKKRYTKKPQSIKRREALHPLLDENVSSARKGTFQKIFSKDEYFFKDHLVNEKYVLPGVCHLEMAAYGAALWGERPAVSLQNVWYMEPIVTGTDPRSVMIEFEAEKEHISYVIKEKGAAKHSLFARRSDL